MDDITDLAECARVTRGHVRSDHVSEEGGKWLDYM
jgi:hypothetical protein